MWARPERLKSSRTSSRELLVLAEDHAAEQRRLGRRQAPGEAGLGAAPGTVHDAERPTSSFARPTQAADVDRGGRAAAALVLVVPPEGRHRAGDLHDLPHAGPAARVGGRSDAEHGDAEARQPSARHGRPARPLADRLEQHGARLDRLPVHVRQRPTFERAEPDVRDHRPGHDGGRDDDGDARHSPASDGARDRGDQGGERCRRERGGGRDRAEQEAGGEREEDGVAGMAVDRVERRCGAHLTPAPARAGRRGGRRRCRTPRRAPRPSRSRRAPRGSRGCAGRWSARSRRARRAARASRC